MEQKYLTLWDLVLTPIYLLVLTVIARRQRDKRYPIGHPLRPYFLKGLYAKFAGAIFIALIYQFYYGAGDTFFYYEHSTIINSSLHESIGTWFKLITRQSVENNPELYRYSSQMLWYTDPPSYTVAIIAALFGLLNGTTYLPIALLFAYFSFTGIWAMYRTFVNIYPTLYKQLAVAFLFIPSTFVWGSAVFKDTVCMFGLGWMVYCTFRIFINRDFSVKNLFLLVFSFYLVAVIKVYILLAFLPALGIWLFLTYSYKIPSKAARAAAAFFFIGLSVGAFFFVSKQFAKELNRYSLENIASTAYVTNGYINYVSTVQEGSGYNLGEFSPTLGGMLTKFPQAVVVTLYRPFLWEAKKPIMFLSALESLGFLILTLLVFFRLGFLNVFKRIAADANLVFFAIFSLIFAFAVGVSTGNFGTLSRYKIPCMPFFAALLLILYYTGKRQHSKQKNNAANASRPVRHLA